MQLIDVMPKRTMVRSQTRDKDFSAAYKAHDELSAVVKIAHHFEGSRAREMIETVEKSFLTERLSAYAMKGSLDANLLESPEDISHPSGGGYTFNRSLASLIHGGRTIELADLRKAVDALDYALIPIGMLDERLLPPEKEREQIRSFSSEARRAGLLPMVLAPCLAYRPSQHAADIIEMFRREKALSIGQVYARPERMCALTSLVAQTEMLIMVSCYSRDTQPDLSGSKGARFESALQIRGDHYKTRAEYEAIWISQYIAWLERVSTKRTREELARDARSELDRLNAIIHPARNEGYFRPINDIDPIMFALPPQVSLGDDFPAILGPCWGPDLPKELLALLMPIFGKGGAR